MIRSRLSLSSRFALFSASTLAVTALAIYLLLSFLAVHQSEHQAQQTVEVAGQVMSRLVKTQADSLQAQCQFVIAKTGIGPLATSQDRRTINDSLYELLGMLHVNDAVLVGRQGSVLGGTQELAGSAIERAHLTTREPWSGIVTAQWQARLVLITPIQDPATQEPQGALLVYRNLDNQLAKELSEALHAQITFMLEGKPIATSEQDGVHQADDSSYIHSQTVLPDDTTDGRLTLLLSLPRTALLAGFERERVLVLWVFLVTCTLVVSLAAWLAHNLTQPLEEVISAAQQVRAGTWPEALPVHGQGELGLLQEVFNDMTASLRANQLVTIQTLAAAVDARDAYTRGHSDRVADYARRLAESLGLERELVERIHTIGTLHDVGKIAIPDAVLLKPGALDANERRIMESHSVRSEALIRNVPALAKILPGIRHHHERWDGKGYPDGLVREAIPLEARILALADTFDALTSDRPYRKGWSFGRALVEIKRCTGTQFDPALVPYFTALWETELTAEQAEEHKAA